LCSLKANKNEQNWEVKAAVQLQHLWQHYFLYEYTKKGLEYVSFDENAESAASVL
jgi:hypothetical protein